jgi:hypothetical protein
MGDGKDRRRARYFLHALQRPVTTDLVIKLWGVVAGDLEIHGLVDGVFRRTAAVSRVGRRVEVSCCGGMTVMWGGWMAGAAGGCERLPGAAGGLTSTQRPSALHRLP